MAIRAVLDASAILALLFEEPGAERLTGDLLDSAATSTVNLAEVQARLVRVGQPEKEAWEDALAHVKRVEEFTLDQAKIAGSLILQTQPRGLSLGDRACLALAITLGVPVYTTEQVWRGLEVGVPIHVIR